MKSAGLVLAAILLFLVVAVDFTGRLMSVLADGVLVGGEGACRYTVMQNNSIQKVSVMVVIGVVY